MQPKKFDPKKLKDTLPKKPSALIRLALADLAVIEKDKRYKVDMGVWHMPYDKCLVCLAGSVMANSLNVPVDCGLCVDPYDDQSGLPADVFKKLVALDLFRLGDIEVGLSRLGLKLPEFLAYSVEMPDYDYDRRGFKRQMAKLASVFEAVGL